LVLSGSKSLTDDKGIIRHIEELSLMVEAMKEIAFGNALVAEMEKQGNHCLVEKIVMDRATATYVIHQNML
jgi:hypothetical protein